MKLLMKKIIIINISNMHLIIKIKSLNRQTVKAKLREKI